MGALVGTIAAAVGVFAATNVDDLVFIVIGTIILLDLASA